MKSKKKFDKGKSGHKVFVAEKGFVKTIAKRIGYELDGSEDLIQRRNHLANSFLDYGKQVPNKSKCFEATASLELDCVELHESWCAFEKANYLTPVRENAEMLKPSIGATSATIDSLTLDRVRCQMVEDVVSHYIAYTRFLREKVKLLEAVEPKLRELREAAISRKADVDLSTAEIVQSATEKSRHGVFGSSSFEEKKKKRQSAPASRIRKTSVGIRQKGYKNSITGRMSNKNTEDSSISDAILDTPTKRASADMSSTLSSSPLPARVFGRSLDELLQEEESIRNEEDGREHEDKTESLVKLTRHSIMEQRVPEGVPAFIHQCIMYLDSTGLKQQGLFRVTGDRKQVQALRKRIEAGENPLSLGGCHPNVVCSILKQYFRELPDCIVTFEAIPALWAMAWESEEFLYDSLYTLFNLLPRNRVSLLAYFINFLNRVAAEESNQMDTTNLASVIAPNIMYSRYPIPDNLLVDAQNASYLLEAIMWEEKFLFSGISEQEKGDSVTKTGEIDSEKEGVEQASNPVSPKKESSGEDKDDGSNAGQNGEKSNTTISVGLLSLPSRHSLTVGEETPPGHLRPKHSARVPVHQGRTPRPDEMIEWTREGKGRECREIVDEEVKKGERPKRESSRRDGVTKEPSSKGKLTRHKSSRKPTKGKRRSKNLKSAKENGKESVEDVGIKSEDEMDSSHVSPPISPIQTPLDTPTSSPPISPRRSSLKPTDSLIASASSLGIPGSSLGEKDKSNKEFSNRNLAALVSPRREGSVVVKRKQHINDKVVDKIDMKVDEKIEEERMEEKIEEKIAEVAKKPDKEIPDIDEKVKKGVLPSGNNSGKLKAYSPKMDRVAFMDKLKMFQRISSTDFMSGTSMEVVPEGNEMKSHKRVVSMGVGVSTVKKRLEDDRIDQTLKETEESAEEEDEQEEEKEITARSARSAFQFWEKFQE